MTSQTTGDVGMSEANDATLEMGTKNVYTTTNPISNDTARESQGGAGIQSDDGAALDSADRFHMADAVRKDKLQIAGNRLLVEQHSVENLVMFLMH